MEAKKIVLPLEFQYLHALHGADVTSRNSKRVV